MAIGKITSKSLDSNAVTSTNLAPGAVTIADIATVKSQLANYILHLI